MLLLEVRLIGVGAEETQFIHGCKLQYGMNIIQMKWDVTGTISTRIFELIPIPFLWHLILWISRRELVRVIKDNIISQFMNKYSNLCISIARREINDNQLNGS